MNLKSLLIDEPPLQVLPTLASRIGLENAIIVQKLQCFLIAGVNVRTIDGERWIYNTYEDWKKFFPFWSVEKIKRHFIALEKEGLIVSCQPEGAISRRKYYRLNREAVESTVDNR